MCNVQHTWISVSTGLAEIFQKKFETHSHEKSFNEYI